MAPNRNNNGPQRIKYSVGVDRMVAQTLQHVPVVVGKRQLVAAFTSRILVDKIATVDEHVCGESQVLRVFSGIFGQCDKQQGHRGEALLAIDEQTPADTIRADAAFLHPMKWVLSGCLPAVTMSAHNCRHCASPHEYLR